MTTLLDRLGYALSGSLGSSRAQSEVIGAVLLIGMVVIGTTGIIALGSQVLNATEQRSETASAQQAMAQFDSKAARVALGDSAVQSMAMGQTGDGRFSVHAATDWESDPAAGSVEIVHAEYDGSNDEVLYQGGLGSVVYERDGTTIGYQGGGVWRQDETGDARMISPPELYYQRSTLTFPIIQTQGTDSGGGVTSTTVSELTDPTAVFPATEASNPRSPYDSTNTPYHNSIQDGEIRISVTSPYAGGWEQYFKQRLDNDEEPDRDGNTVTVTLTPTGTQGRFPMPDDGSFLSVQGFESTHPSFGNDPYRSQLSDFEISIRPDNSDSAKFANLQWGLYTKQGSQEFGIHIRRQSGKDCSNPPTASATIYYTNDYGNTYQGWYDPDAFSGTCGDFDGDGDQEIKLVADLAGSNEMEYRSLSKSETGDEVSASGGATLTDPVSFDQHAGDSPTAGGTRTYGSGDTETMGRLMDHYFTSLGPSFPLFVDDKNSDTVSEQASFGVIRYPNTANSITFLHVTENEIEVELN